MTRRRWTTVVAAITCVPALLLAWTAGYLLDVTHDERSDR